MRLSLPCRALPSSTTRRMHPGCGLIVPCHIGALPSSRPRHPARGTTKLPAIEEEAKVAVSVVTPEENTDVEAPFLEPAVRSFALGVGAGCILEFLHVLLEFMTAATAEGSALFSNLAALPNVLEALEAAGPQVAWDNAVALAACALFYGMEVSAILPVLKQHGDDKQQVAQAITSLPTLPKRLMPVKLKSIKQALYALIALRNPAAALSHASAFLGGGNDDGGGPIMIGSPRAPSNVRAGTAVLERPRTDPVPRPSSRPPGDGDDDEEAARLKDSRSLAPRRKQPASPAGRTTTPTKPHVQQQQQPKTAGAKQQSQQGVKEGGRGSLAPGAWDPAKQLPLSRRSRELSDRRSYLSQCWYAAALSKSLVAGKPLQVKLLGRTVVLFRDEQGVAHCLDNLCPHRGAPLGQGWTKQVEKHTCVVCPYHGWSFDGEGKLREVPSSADQTRLPKRPLVDAYPVVEQGGFVYLFFGDKSMPEAERPPVPASFCPELSDPSWQAVYGEMEFDAPHFSVFDNALDMAHIHYLHSDSFGNSSKPIIMDMTTEKSDWGISGSFSIYNKPVNAMWEWTKVESVPVQFAAWLPSTSYVKITLGAGVQMITYVNTVPIDANRSINRFCLIRNFAGWEGFDVWARNAMYKILSEDKVMVEQLRPEAMPVEVSLEADRPQLAFRKLRQAWVESGYLVQPELTELHNGSLDVRVDM